MSLSVVTTPEFLAGSTFPAFYTTPCLQFPTTTLDFSNIAIADARFSAFDIQSSIVDFRNVTVFNGISPNQSFAYVIRTQGARQGFMEVLASQLQSAINSLSDADRAPFQLLKLLIFEEELGDLTWASFLATEFWKRSICPIPTVVTSAVNGIPLGSQRVNLTFIPTQSTPRYLTVTNPLYIVFVFIPFILLPILLISLIAFKCKKLKDAEVLTKSAILLSFFGVVQAVTLRKVSLHLRII
jgi:hypothetical protein